MISRFASVGHSSWICCCAGCQQKTTHTTHAQHTTDTTESEEQNRSTLHRRALEEAKAFDESIDKHWKQETSKRLLKLVLVLLSVTFRRRIRVYLQFLHHDTMDDDKRNAINEEIARLEHERGQLNRQLEITTKGTAAFDTLSKRRNQIRDKLCRLRKKLDPARRQRDQAQARERKRNERERVSRNRQPGPNNNQIVPMNQPGPNNDNTVHMNQGPPLQLAVSVGNSCSVVFESSPSHLFCFVLCTCRITIMATTMNL